MQTCLHQTARSSLLDGIETIVIPITHPGDLNRLAIETGRGIYSVCEWLLTELGRWAELDRVCGLNVSTGEGVVVVNLELRQPGKQFEEWMGAEHNRFTTEGETLVISDRARRLNEKFTKEHRPYWETNIVRTLQESDRIIP